MAEGPGATRCHSAASCVGLARAGGANRGRPALRVYEPAWLFMGRAPPSSSKYRLEAACVPMVCLPRQAASAKRQAMRWAEGLRWVQRAACYVADPFPDLAMTNLWMPRAPQIKTPGDPRIETSQKCPGEYLGGARFESGKKRRVSDFCQPGSVLIFGRRNGRTGTHLQGSRAPDMVVCSEQRLGVPSHRVLTTASSLFPPSNTARNAASAASSSRMSARHSGFTPDACSGDIL